MSIIKTTEAMDIVKNLWSLENEVSECKHRAKVLSTCVLISEKGHEDAKNLYKEISDNDKARVVATQKAMRECKEIKDAQLLIEQVKQYVNDLKNRLNVIEFDFAEVEVDS